MPDKYACGYVIEYKDDGPADEQVLHIGTREECERLEDNLCAVSIPSTRPVKECRFVIVPYKE